MFPRGGTKRIHAALYTMKMTDHKTESGLVRRHRRAVDQPLDAELDLLCLSRAPELAAMCGMLLLRV